MKTSSRISRQFTLIVGILITLFVVILNIVFFVSRYRPEKIFLLTAPTATEIVQRKQGRPFDLNPRFVTFPAVDFDMSQQEHIRYASDVIAVDEYWFMLARKGPMIYATDVTQSVRRQQALIAGGFLLLFIFVSLTYLVSRWFVRRSLKDLYALAHQVQDADIENLHTSVMRNNLPDDDEINIVAYAIDTMKMKLHQQIQSIKDFVAHVSHEFKTPLMVLRSDTDLARKTGEYEELIAKNTETIGHMQSMLEGLLALTTSQIGKDEMTDVNMSLLVKKITETMAKKYADKDISVTKELPPHIFITTYEAAAESIIANILDNAYKYTLPHGAITVSLSAEKCVIADTGIGIAEKDTQKVREPFRQADKNRHDGVGLGLSIVQKLAEVLNRKVQMTTLREDGQIMGTEITLFFPEE